MFNTSTLSFTSLVLLTSIERICKVISYSCEVNPNSNIGGILSKTLNSKSMESR